MTQFHQNPRVVPSPQELSGLPAAIIAAEIVNIEAVLANRYNPNTTFAELCDKVGVDGKVEERAFWADITRYRANLYMAQQVQALEPKGIGMLDARTGDGGGCSPWGGYGW